MKKYKKLFRFYTQLLELMSEEMFNVQRAKVLAVLFKEINEDPQRRKLDYEWLKRTHAYRVNRPNSFKVMDSIFGIDLAVFAFEDLAPYLRHPEVRVLVKKWYSLAGFDETGYVFTQVRNFRPLDPNYPKDGPAAITLVVSSLSQFNEFYRKVFRSSRNLATVREVWGSYDKDLLLGYS